MKRLMTDEEERIVRKLYPFSKREKRAFYIDDEIPAEFLAATSGEIVFSADIADEIKEHETVSHD